MGKTVWDFVDSVFTKHGVAGIMLLAVSFMYWDSRTYERAQDKETERAITEIAVRIERIDKSVNRLEDKVFFVIDSDGDGRDDDEKYAYNKEEDNEKYYR